MDAPVELLARDRANADQRAASDPAVSAWVSASAGSGKTKLLTDRLLRLMLGGADPARIQCLTYTKAAAAEMALRLRHELGRWVTLRDAELDLALHTLDVQPDTEKRKLARALFATVLDLPGGMRIGTIHAFCQSLLRRFPLEARISPHFRLIEDAQADAARRDATEMVLGPIAPEQLGLGPKRITEEQRRQALADVAGLANLAQFDALVCALIAERDRLADLLARPFAAIEAQQRAALCAERDAETILRDAVIWSEESAVRDALCVIAGQGTPKQSAPAAQLRLDWLAAPPHERRKRWAEYEDTFVKDDGGGYSWKTLSGQALGRREPAIREILEREQARVLAIREALRAARLAETSAALLRLALPIAQTYAAGKQAAIRLDYADLIERTTALLRDPGVAWVLYKLDGGLDHLLLDEAQDTAPAQWRIAEQLVAEFFSGAGARDKTARTVFAVGDRKQSIFSFQGADPAAFTHWREKLRRRVEQSAAQWREVSLTVSFRSTTPVLALVDAVFGGAVPPAGVVEGDALTHRSDREGQAGFVELWPLVPPPPQPEPPPWQVPVHQEQPKTAPQRLAEDVAEWISGATAGDTMLPSRSRPLRPGDILVLLRTREKSQFARALVRCLKQRGVPVAGLDRMVLTEQPAVADLLALCDTLLLPQDDLSLACVLTSPLGGLSDDSLMALAAERPGTLWQELHDRARERQEWTRAQQFLDALFARVDFAAPHALMTEALGALGGRARLLARFGHEAAEPIDEFLAAALAHARDEPPSLQGFVHWLRRSGAEVKREAQGPGGMVRVMTVHGAKGLQAPVVILPDTTGLPKQDDRLLWAGQSGAEVPVWCPHADLRCDSAKTLRDAAAARRAEEYHRLLYVALTRAEDGLIVCGYQARRPALDACWYRLIEQGFARLDAQTVPMADGGARRRFASAQRAAPDRVVRTDAMHRRQRQLPAWAGAAPDWRAAAPPREPVVPSRLAPSRPASAQFGPVPAATSPLFFAGGGQEGRFRRGRVLHTLLQHLPDLPHAERAAAAVRFLSRPGHGFSPEEIGTALADILAVLDAPELAPLFGPGSRAEVPLTGRIGENIVGGLVDRLAVLPDRVLVADYKTGRAPPSRAENVPVLYLRQMAAYRAVLRAAHPGRPVECLLVWTEGARIMALADDLLDRHAPMDATGGAAAD